MKPGDIPLPVVTSGASYSAFYGLYLHSIAWLLRKLVAAMSGNGSNFDQQVEIATPDLGEGNIRLSICLPSTSRGQGEERPCILIFEGGGFILGQPNDGENLFVSLDYAKAPRYPFPHALLQGYEVLKWLLSSEAYNALGISIDHSRVATLGKSAGGNLAASLALLVAFDSGPCAHFRRQLGPKFKHVAQILLYPSTACHQRYRERCAKAPTTIQAKSLPIWAAELMEACYLPPGTQPNQIFVAPTLAEVSLVRALESNLPRFGFFLAGLDCLKLEAYSFATVLKDGGVHVDTCEYPEAVHGFIQYKPGAKEYRQQDVKDCEEKIIQLLGEEFEVKLSATQ
ncbi:alpha/beta-hydrolase [Thozetella sp. PMI_491]|nr:alpha/beta-hydrolase [Thozetella sp. PMI_491]